MAKKMGGMNKKDGGKMERRSGNGTDRPLLMERNLMMKRTTGFVKAGLLALGVGLVCLGSNRLALAQDKMQGGMNEDHGAMMKMMQDRPKAMKKADADVQKQKAAAAKKGMYGCCLKHPCDFCALKMGSCPCGKMASMDKPVCNECKGGWAAGDGAIPDKTADQIKTMPRMDMKMGDTKMGKVKPAAVAGKRVVVNTCPITGEKVVGAGAGMSLVGNYEVHFCCAGCKPAFDKMTKTEQMAKVKTLLDKS